MGRKHCRNKWEVLQRVQQQKRQKREKPQPILKSRLQTINQIKPAIERANKETEKREGQGGKEQ